MAGTSHAGNGKRQRGREKIVAEKAVWSLSARHQPSARKHVHGLLSNV